MLQSPWDRDDFWADAFKDVDLDPTNRPAVPVARGACVESDCSQAATTECCICSDALCTLHVQYHPTTGVTYCLTHWLRHGPSPVLTSDTNLS